MREECDSVRWVPRVLMVIPLALCTAVGVWSQTVLQVGPGQTYATIQAAVDAAVVFPGPFARDPGTSELSWDDYVLGQRWNLILDVKPAKGQRVLMETAPGLIHSGTDFNVNSAGICVTKTTIGNFVGFDPSGVPEFQRARKAVQYSKNLDGANDGKVVTAGLAKAMSFWARGGHPDGSPFAFGPFLAEHPEFAWQAPYLKDLVNRPWSLFEKKDRP